MANDIILEPKVISDFASTDKYKFNHIGYPDVYDNNKIISQRTFDVGLKDDFSLYPDFDFSIKKVFAIRLDLTLHSDVFTGTYDIYYDGKLIFSNAINYAGPFGSGWAQTPQFALSPDKKIIVVFNCHNGKGQVATQVYVPYLRENKNAEMTAYTDRLISIKGEDPEYGIVVSNEGKNYDTTWNHSISFN